MQAREFVHDHRIRSWGAELINLDSMGNQQAALSFCYLLCKLGSKNTNMMVGALNFLFVYIDISSLSRVSLWLDLPDTFYLQGQLGVFEEPGKVTRQSLSPGDVGFVPRGTGHWIKNTSSQPGFLILVFNSPSFTNVDLPGWLGSFPASVCFFCPSLYQQAVLPIMLTCKTDSLVVFLSVASSAHDPFSTIELDKPLN